MADYATVNDSIILGSGELYCALATEVEGKTEDLIIPLLKCIGAIDGGAEISYSPNNITVKPANRGKFFIKSDEDATFKTGVMNLNVDNLSFVAPTTITEDPTTHKKTIVVGGKKDSPVVYLRFIHKETDGSQVIVTMPKAKANKGMKFTFDEKNPTVIDYEFDSLTTMQDEGAFTIDLVPAPTV